MMQDRTGPGIGEALDGVRNCGWLTLQHVGGGEGGSLTVAEPGSGLPFQFRRVYYMTGVRTPGAVRGRHAHRTLDQALFCLNGSVRLLVDDGKEKAEVLLDAPQRGVFLGPLVWHELHDFTPACVVLVFAAEPYDESDYIRDYGEFLELAGHG